MSSPAKWIIVLFTLLIFSVGVSARAGDRFTDNGDGTVTDHQLKLMWARHDNQGDITWKEAERYCKMGPAQVMGKYENWRMPTLAELESLYVRDKSVAGYETDCGQKVRIVPIIRLSCGWVWTGEKRSITAKVFNFHRGYSYTDRRVHRKAYRALPVRNLPPGEK